MDRRAAARQDVWTDAHATQSTILKRLKFVMRRARQEDLGPASFEQLDSVVGRVNSEKAKGIDSMGSIG
eukprot:1994264-Pyramimonas_sp.AAC.1